MFKNLFKKGTFLLGLWMWAMAAFAADANTATAQELMEIKGIGESTAQRIIEERANGQFKDWDDFIGRVKGVGKGKAKKLSDAGLTIGDATYTPPAKEKGKDRKEKKENRKGEDKTAQ